MRRPLGRVARITGDTASHALYGVGPATDYGTDVGEPIYATFSGYVDLNWYSDSGWTIDIFTAGKQFRGAHLSAFAVNDGQAVSEGDPIGYTGNTGVTTGPHLHCYFVIDGKRWAVEEYFAIYPPTTTAGGGSTPIGDDPTSGDEDMAQILITAASPHFGVGQRILLPAAGPFTVAGKGQTEGFPLNGEQPGSWAEQLLIDRGMWEFVNDGTLAPGPVTGRILGGPSGLDAQGAPVAAFPKVAAAIDAALLERLITAAFDDLSIPTPAISAADKKAIIDGAAAKGREVLAPDFAAIAPAVIVEQKKPGN